MSRRRQPPPTIPRGWAPTVGDLARYESRYSGLSKGCPVRIAAEARGGRWRVEIIGRRGNPVFITVKATHLYPMPPSLF